MPVIANNQDLLESWRTRTAKSGELHRRARKTLPLGVGSNFRAMDPHPIFVREARGSKLWDVDGNEYVDFAMGFGAMFVGHSHPAVVRAVAEQAGRGTLMAMAHPLECELSEEVCRRFQLERVRFTNSGTESTMHALRLARAFTGRPKIIKFEGSFHGCHDAVLSSVKPSASELGELDLPGRAPASRGIPEESLVHTLTARFNDLASVERHFQRYPGEIAAVIAEPVMLNVTICPPKPGFFEAIQKICRWEGSLLILDEVKTGARLAPGSVGRSWGLSPDLVCLAKAIGGGLPLGAFGGRADIMNLLETGRVAHTGTYNTNPMCLAASLAALREVLTPEVYSRTERLSRRLADGYRDILRRRGLAWPVTQMGPVGSLHFTAQPPTHYRDWLATDEAAWERYWYGMTLRGVIPQPHGSEEQWTISAQHTDEDIDRHLEAFHAVSETL